jgi:hypothetical protein
MANTTTATVRAAAEEVAKRGELLPHQFAAFSTFDQAISPEQRRIIMDAATRPPAYQAWFVEQFTRNR